MSEYVGDLANQIAQKLQDEHVQEAIDAPEKAVDEAADMFAEQRNNIFAKLEFRWRTSDKKVLDQIRAAANGMFAELYADAFDAIDDLYMKARVPQRDGESEQIVRDSQGRVVWQRDSRGRFAEDWDQLTGQDLEVFLLGLERIKLVLAPQLSDLLMEAIFAKHVADDARADAFSKLLDGTIPDREAHASRESRQDKYFAYFRYYIYSQAKVFHDELANLARLVERIRYWRVTEQK
ncbi:hypothetical protein SEA_SKOG_218 [Gordonia phage Skog]|uniref:Uncharacterized protein n=1 Tax=Gordonia phage Skog TaxID=2704033 RepID=A0A6G6XKT2_9CAUD|nr:hypothetical protein KHQ85_gp218 [Gordonia phage Skog]QIG58370.1 hypothetical protein SEA_SKOG_218 [Gordonia phage Skog]